MIGASLRALVRRRAGDRCEYCRCRQEFEPFIAYQVEHVVAKQHGGADTEDNLALACPQCNLHKGPNLAGIDPTTGLMEPLFHPRRQAWPDHFEEQGPHILGKTPIGRVTVRVLEMNAEARVDLRREIAETGG